MERSKPNSCTNLNDGKDIKIKLEDGETVSNGNRKAPAMAIDSEVLIMFPSIEVGLIFYHI